MQGYDGPMSDQPLTKAALEQFFRSFARPDLDRLVEQRMEETRQRGEHLYVRSALWSLKFHESMYGFLHDDIRRLERRLDEIHVRIDRNDSWRMADTLQLAHDYYDDALATWTRLKGYLPEGEESIAKVADGPPRDRLREQAVDLRRRVDALAPDLDTARMRLNRYTQRAG